MVNITLPKANLGPLNKYKKYATPTNLLVVGGLAFAAYFGYQYLNKDAENKEMGGTGISMKLLPDPNDFNSTSNSIGDTGEAIFQVIPPVVKSNQIFRIEGAFTDLKRNKITVPQGWFYLFHNISPTQKKLVASGLLGEDISEFSKTFQYPSLPEGNYTIIVTDRQLHNKQVGI